jgi:hypothetical protein
VLARTERMLKPSSKTLRSSLEATKKNSTTEAAKEN